MQPSLHFAHANGYPPDAYRQLIEALTTDVPVLAMPFKPLTSARGPEDVQTWHDLAEDLIRYLDQQASVPVVGIGHSLGGVVTLLAAVRRPDLFASIILLDPVFLPRWIYWLKVLVPHRFRGYLVPLARIARRRRDHWPSREVAWDHLRKKRVFARISDPVFDDMLESMLKDLPDGTCTLTFSRDWEARIYTTVTNPWSALRRVSVPTLILKGRESDTIQSRAWDRMKRLLPNGYFVEMEEVGHLLPLEQPLAVASTIKSFLYGND
ncbi:MAG: alpha/beta fold hydrolase [Saprospiraceae bacterium]|nr:alpha/beta fold hydrolase [Saprospiraceae bacterium]